MTTPGYYRYPTMWNDSIVFVTEDDLWHVSSAGGAARRLSANPGRAGWCALSPDGRWLAYTSLDEGHFEVYVMPAEGGPARRLTYLGSTTRVVGWRPDGSAILFASDAAHPFAGQMHLHEIAPEGGTPRPLALGPALGLAMQPDGPARVLWRNGGGRRMGDPAMWKRYRGGTAGTLWIDPRGTNAFRPLLKLDGDLASPMWVGTRIYFLSDHEGVGNLYSCRPSGRDVRRHTDHGDFYVRFPQTDGRRIVYTAGADIYLYDPAEPPARLVPVETASSRPQRSRKFVDSAQYLEGYALHPDGHALCVTTRGRPFTFAHWEDAVLQYGRPDGVRYRLAQWLPDGVRLVAVSDGEGEETLTILHPDGRERLVRLRRDVGRATALAAAPAGADRVALTNHRNELFIVELKTRKCTRVDASRYGAFCGMAWSADGRWLAYSVPASATTIGLQVFEVATGKTRPLTRPDFRDMEPVFDPDGRYLFFISQRDFDPVYDNQIFDLGFPRSQRVFALPLQQDAPSPFVPTPRPPVATPRDGDGKKDGPQARGRPPRVKIDFDGIADRVVASPFPEAQYGQVRTIPGKLLVSSFGVEGSLGVDWRGGQEPAARGHLEAYDLVEHKQETLVQGITDFEVSADGSALAYRAGWHMRVLPAGAPAPEGQDHAPTGRESGWIDLGRVRVSVDPGAEWVQMYHEAWRLQRDHFWVADMSGVDWDGVRDRYRPLVDRVAARSELSDLLWEVQGELGTSHAYEMGGDYRPPPAYLQGFLGADLEYDPTARTWRVAHIPRGDSWNPEYRSPLAAPGVNLKPRDRILAVGNRRVGATLSPAECLVHLADQDVVLAVAESGGKHKRTVTVHTLKSEYPLRYRDWVERNRAHVHAATRGRAGYVHIPDMGPEGFAEFHRYFITEVNHDALIVDVRFNGGGHVSPLILEKLLRKRIGYDRVRWSEPEPYPQYSVAGPLVALTNEFAGSDGDIFSHCFKLYGLGPLIGKRTWGGVIGISPQHALVDGSLTTQPEYSFWFRDVGYAVENYGTDPDIEVDIRPQDHAAGKDPQLERGIREIVKLLRAEPPLRPALKRRPRLPTAKLPRRR